MGRERKKEGDCPRDGKNLHALMSLRGWGGKKEKIRLGAQRVHELLLLEGKTERPTEIIFTRKHGGRNNSSVVRWQTWRRWGKAYVLQVLRGEAHRASDLWEVKKDRKIRGERPVENPGGVLQNGKKEVSRFGEKKEGRCGYKKQHRDGDKGGFADRGAEDAYV